MNNSTLELLNVSIRNILPKVNYETRGDIKSKNLDPWGQVAHGQQNFGTVNLGIFDAKVKANYNVKNMTGLSFFYIYDMQVTHVENNSNVLTGGITMSACSRNNFLAQIGGIVDDYSKNGIPQTQINGSVNVDRITATATGSFKASINGNEVSLKTITISGLSINYDGFDVSTGELGIFNKVSGKLKEAIIVLFRQQVVEAMSSALTPIINEGFGTVLSQS